MDRSRTTVSHRLLAFCLAAGMVIAPLSAGAQSTFDPQPESIDTYPTDEVAPSGLDAKEEMPLALEQAIAVALKRNLSLMIQRYDRARFSLQVPLALSIYDANLNAFGRTNSETSPAATQIDGADVNQRDTQQFNLGLDQLTPIGGRADINFNVFEQETNSQFATVNPSVFVDLDFGYTQPLLRNAGKSVTERGISIARVDSQISEETFEQQVITLVQNVVNQYFALVEAREQLVVAEESRALAIELHDMNRIRVEVGTLAPLELIQSEAGIAQRELDIIRAQFAVEDAEDDLRRLLNFEEGELWNVSIVPNAPDEIQRLDIDLHEAIAAGLEERSEVQAQRLEVEKLEIESAYRGNQKLARLDLRAQYGFNGLGGDFIVEPGNPDSEVIEGGFSDAWKQVRDGDFEGWEIRLDFGIPLQNRAAKTQSAIADLNLQQAEAQLDDLEQLVTLEIRKAVRAVRTAAQAYDSQLVSVRLEEKNYEAEQKRYDNGLSTSFQVLQIQEDLTTARQNLVASIASYRRSVVDYYKVVGSLLGISKVSIVDTVGEEEAERGFWY